MILPPEVLNRIEFYESEPFCDYKYARNSRITLHWKKLWWQFWIQPRNIYIRCVTIRRDGQLYSTPSDEWTELNDQLKEYFQRKSAPVPLKLDSLNML